MDDIQKLKDQIQNLETQVHELEKDLIHDSLTSLKTRSFFEEKTGLVSKIFPFFFLTLITLKK